MDIINFFNKLFKRVSNKQLKRIGMATTRYNCIAYAMGFNTLNIWPIEQPPYMRNGDKSLIFWPTEFPINDESLENFIKLFEKFGYKQCENGSYEKNYRKIAIYCINDSDIVSHAALLVAPRIWKSKLGESYLVEHNTLDALEGKDYGFVRCFVKRPISIKKDFDLSILRSYA